MREFDPFRGLVEPGMKRPPADAELRRRLSKDPYSWDAKPRRLKLKGELREFFSIGDLAKALGRTPATIRRWETANIIPRTPYRAPKPRGEQVPGKQVKGQRLYTRGQVELLVKIANEENVLKRAKDPSTRVDYSEFTRRVVAEWLLA